MRVFPTVLFGPCLVCLGLQAARWLAGSCVVRGLAFSLAGVFFGGVVFLKVSNGPGLAGAVKVAWLHVGRGLSTTGAVKAPAVDTIHLGHVFQ